MNRTSMTLFAYKHIEIREKSNDVVKQSFKAPFGKNRGMGLESSMDLEGYGFEE